MEVCVLYESKSKDKETTHKVITGNIIGEISKSFKNIKSFKAKEITMFFNKEWYEQEPNTRESWPGICSN